MKKLSFKEFYDVVLKEGAEHIYIPTTFDKKKYFRICNELESICEFHDLTRETGSEVFERINLIGSPLMQNFYRKKSLIVVFTESQYKYHTTKKVSNENGAEVKPLNELVYLVDDTEDNILN